jgi:hypothetical protein
MHVDAVGIVKCVYVCYVCVRVSLYIDAVDIVEDVRVCVRCLVSHPLAGGDAMPSYRGEPNHSRVDRGQGWQGENVVRSTAHVGRQALVHALAESMCVGMRVYARVPMNANSFELSVSGHSMVCPPSLRL